MDDLRAVPDPTDPAAAHWKCAEYLCAHFPQCLHATACCGVDDFFEGRTLAAKDCYQLSDKPYFQRKRY